MKAFLMSVLTFLGMVSGIYTNNEQGFELYFNTYNHTESLIASYSILDNNLTVSTNKRFITGKDSIIYTTRISDDIITKIQSLKLEKLDEHYDNKCIMLISGAEYFIGINNGTKLKQIHLHHYYKDEVAQLVGLLNSVLPKEHHINYIERDTQQNCQ